MAAPMVSGTVALMLQQNSNLTPDQVKARLMKTAYKVFPTSSTATDPTTGLTNTSQYDYCWSRLFGCSGCTVQHRFGHRRSRQRPLDHGKAGFKRKHRSGEWLFGDLGNSVLWGTSVVGGTSVLWGTNVSGQSVIWGNSVCWGTSTMQGYSVI
jgi:serine protease AprX